MKTEEEIRKFLALTEGNEPFGREHNEGVQAALRWVLE